MISATRQAGGLFAAASKGLTDAEYTAAWIAHVRSRCVVTGSGCWEWQGFCNYKGYGMNSFRGKNRHLHRLMYQAVKGPIPPKHFVCHRCDVRHCCNPDHLFIGTAADNNRDCGNKGRHHNSVKTHCKRGHEFTPENTYLKVTPTTTMRSCLECQRIVHKKPTHVEWRRQYQRKRREAKKAARAAGASV